MQREHKHKHKMNAVEGHWKQTTVNSLSLPTNQLLPPSLWRFWKPQHQRQGRCGVGRMNMALRSPHLRYPEFPQDYLLGGFKTREAPTRFRPGLTTNIRTPWPFLNSNTGSLGFHRFYEIYFFLLKCKRANENEVWMQRQETGSAVFGCLGEMHCTDTACRTSLHLSVHSFI